MDFSDNLRKYRTLKGLSQKSLAKLIGVSQTAVYSWEKGKMIPKIEQLLNLSHALEIPLNDLVDLTDLHDQNRKLEDIVKNTKDDQERSDAMNEHLNNTLLSKKLENEDMEYIARIYGSLNSDGKEIIKGVCESVIKNEDYRGMIDTKLPPELLKEIFKRK